MDVTKFDISRESVRQGIKTSSQAEFSKKVLQEERNWKREELNQTGTIVKMFREQINFTKRACRLQTMNQEQGTKAADIIIGSRASEQIVNRLDYMDKV